MRVSITFEICDAKLFSIVLIPTVYIYRDMYSKNYKAKVLYGIAIAYLPFVILVEFKINKEFKI